MPMNASSWYRSSKERLSSWYYRMIRGEKRNVYSLPKDQPAKERRNGYLQMLTKERRLQILQD